jgi:hypothetical protein
MVMSTATITPLSGAIPVNSLHLMRRNAAFEHAYSRLKAVKWRFYRYSRELIATDENNMLQ